MLGSFTEDWAFIGVAWARIDAAAPDPSLSAIAYRNNK
jgi:hypothetical protein